MLIADYKNVEVYRRTIL